MQILLQLCDLGYADDDMLMCQNKDLPDEKTVSEKNNCSLKRLHGANAISTIENCHYLAVPIMIVTTITVSTIVSSIFGAMQILLQLNDLGWE